ncbi:hypothetical protein SEA_MARYSWELL_76 [Mycobacterium phage MarysWell]|nr:hypothetical protein SEA_MARYSWELL_76 [Mycobacterium phage MarysWell]
MTTAVETEPFLIREGSSTYTVEELDMRFLEDVAELSNLVTDAELRDRATDLINSANRAYDDPDLDQEDLLETLEWHVHQAEYLLADMGFWVEWNDGYVIYREN